jgi:hypothetical protein
MPLCALHRRLPIPSLGGIAADTPAGTAKMPLNPSLGKKICHPSAFFTPPRLTFNIGRSARPEAPRSLVLPYGINFQATSHMEYLNTFSCDIFATVLRDIFEHPVGKLRWRSVHSHHRSRWISRPAWRDRTDRPDRLPPAATVDAAPDSSSPTSADAAVYCGADG